MMKFAHKRLKYAYASAELLLIAVVGAAFTYAAHFILMRMFGSVADIKTLSVIAAIVTAALAVAAAVTAVAAGVLYGKDAPTASEKRAETAFCIKANVPFSAGKEIKELTQLCDANGVFCLQVALCECMAVQFVAMAWDLRAEAVTYVSGAIALLLAVTLVVGAVRRSKEKPYDADELVRAIAERAAAGERKSEIAEENAAASEKAQEDTAEEEVSGEEPLGVNELCQENPQGDGEDDKERGSDGKRNG